MSSAESKNILTAVAENLKIRDSIWRYPEEGREWTLSSIDFRSRAYARRLRELSVATGDRVGILLDNGSEYAPLLLGIWRLNAIAVPLRPKPGKYFDLAEYLHSVQSICKFRVIIVAAEVDPEAVQQCSEAFQTPILFLPAVLAGHELEPEKDALDSQDAADTHYQDTGILPEDAAIIQFSSGTTGSPKGVVVTHAMMISQLEEINVEVFSGCRGSVVTSSASWLPFNHDMGLFIGLLNPLFVGADNLLASPRYYMFKPRRWFQMMHDYGTTLHFTTNSALHSSFTSLSTIEPGSLNLSRLYLYIGAEKVMPTVVTTAYRILGAFKMEKPNFRIGYGMAENTLGAASTNKPEISIRRFNVDEKGRLRIATETGPETLEVVAFGSPHAGTTITIRDEAGEELPELQLGEIYIEGPCVMGGYFRNASATKTSLVAHRLKTGDIGFVYDNEYYFHSRKDDLLIIGGRNIVPDEIEAQVETMGFIRPTGSVLVSVNEPLTGEMQLRLLVEAKLPVGTKFGLEHRRLIQQKVFESSGLLLQSIQACVSGSVEKTSSGKKRRKIISQRLSRGEIVMVE
jgi:acyl-CoA synthetase (AMP-forming)/AMP-acid ligase II